MGIIGQGKRGVVRLTTFYGKKAAVKTKRSTSKSILSISNEAKWLKILNKKGIGPMFYDFTLDEGNEKLVMEYIEGLSFENYIEKCTAQQRRKIIEDVFLQCREMDKLKVNKLEMHKPYKHILVRKGKAIMLDFERCRKTLKPKNVTQFVEYLARLGFEYDKKDLLTSLRSYKKSYSQKDFKMIFSSFSFS